MFKHSLILLLAAVMALGATGCKGKKTAAEQRAEVEKKWREDQRKAAIRTYNELIEKYPESQQAGLARERLQALGVTPGQNTASK